MTPLAAILITLKWAGFAVAYGTVVGLAARWLAARLRNPEGP